MKKQPKRYLVKRKFVLIELESCLTNQELAHCVRWWHPSDRKDGMISVISVFVNTAKEKL